MRELRHGLLRFAMRYHYEKPSFFSHRYGRTHICAHPVYDRCTLFEIGGRGLAVIQQRFDMQTKHTWWGEIDPWLIDEIYLSPGFWELFCERAGEGQDGIFPTISVRQIMWRLKMKPLKKERWETVFDRREI